MAKREGASTSGPRTRSKAAKEGREAKIIAEHGVEDECDQLRCEFRALKKKQAELDRELWEKEDELRYELEDDELEDDELEEKELEKKLEEQLRPLRRELEQLEEDWLPKRKRLKDLCDAREAENTQRLLGMLPHLVWEKIVENLEDADLFPLALSSRYFRQKQKDLVARTRQNGPKSRRVLKTKIMPIFEKSQPASAEYIRFCSKQKLSHRMLKDQITHNHFRCLAAFHGHLSLLQELLEPFRSDPDSTKNAARGGSQKTVSSFVKKLTPKEDRRRADPERYIFGCACKGGHLEIMKWLMSEGVPLIPANCADAAEGGHMEILKFLRSKGCTWNDNIRWRAAQGGNLEIMKWLSSEGCTWDVHSCRGAAKRGHMEALRWLRSKGCPWDEQTCACAAQGGHLEVLKWLRSEGCPWDGETCAGAAMNGHLEMLKWLRSEGCPWNWDTCSGAARYGHLEILKWLRSEGCPWDEWTCIGASTGRHLDVLKYAHENGCPWDNRVIQHTNDQACFDYARNNGCDEIEPNYGHDSDEDDM